MIAELHVAWAWSQAGQLLASGTWMDQEDVVARLGNRLVQASDILKSWIMQQGGTPIFDVTVQGAFKVPADKVYDLGRIIEQLRIYVESDAFFGVGIGIKESGQALQQAYTSQVPYAFYDEAAGADKGGDDQQHLDEQLNDNPLEKAVNDGNDHWMPAEKSQNEAQANGGPQNPSGVAQPQGEGSEEGPPPPPTPQDGGDSESSESSDEQANDGSQEQDAKAVVVKALQAIKAQAAAIQQLKQVSPEAFAAVAGIVQALVLLAHSASGKEEDVQKAEDLFKRLHLPKPKLSSKKPAPMKYPDALASPASEAGTIKDGKIKVAPVDAESGQAKEQGWNQARSGMVVGPSGSAVSSRQPNTE
jgi:hypothetical protein